MPRQQMDYIGKTFGDEKYCFTVISRFDDYVSPKGAILKQWLCRCGCGKEFVSTTSNLKKIRSCGCSHQTAMHGRKKDLVGMVFGDKKYNVTVLQEIDPYITPQGTKHAQWLCQCSCGNFVKTTTGRLNEGSTTHCGCKNKDEAIWKNSIGKRYDMLKVLSVAEEPSVENGYKAKMRCVCDCGNTIEVLLNSLQTGNTTSCGCKKTVDLTGMDVGYLHVIGLAEPESKNGRKRRKWLCQCTKCGTITIQNTDNLTRKMVSSCGCVMSKGEEKIANVLSQLNIKYKKQKTFDTCRNPRTNALLKFDFELTDSQVLIEFDGIQHIEPSSGWNSITSYEDLVFRDTIKNNWCEKNNKILIRIPHTDLDKINAAYLLSCIRLAEMESINSAH